MGLIKGNQISGSVVSASYALTASYALNAAAGGSGFSITSGSVSASVNITDSIFLIQSGTFTPFSITNIGLTTISGSATDLFLIKKHKQSKYIKSKSKWRSSICNTIKLTSRSSTKWRNLFYFYFFLCWIRLVLL